MADRVRARFYVASIERFSYGDNLVVKLQAVTRQDASDDNVQWSKFTPSGEIKLSITNPDAWPFYMDAMDQGRDVYVDFSLVPVPDREAAGS